jgi:hypothetical protein
MQGILDDEEIAQIRADVAEVACDLPCVIQRSTGTPEPQGGETLTWTTVSPDGLLAGMASPTGAQLQSFTNFGFLDGIKSAWQVNFPYGTDVRKGDHLLIDGETLDVVTEVSPQSYAALTTVVAVRAK